MRLTFRILTVNKKPKIPSRKKKTSVMNFRKTAELEMKNREVPQSWAMTDTNWGECEAVQHPQEITIFKGMRRREKAPGKPKRELPI